jgi:hypothetical protein
MHINDATLIVYLTVTFFKPSDICYKISKHSFTNFVAFLPWAVNTYQGSLKRQLFWFKDTKIIKIRFILNWNFTTNILVYGMYMFTQLKW